MIPDREHVMDAVLQQEVTYMYASLPDSPQKNI